MTFGERLVELRKEKGFNTRNEFAEKLGIPGTTLRNYETNAREPGHTFLKQISELFNVSVDYLLCLTDDKEVLNNFRLRSSEQDIVEKYRNLDGHGKEMVDFTLQKEWERSTAPAQEKIIEIPSHLIPNAANAIENASKEESQFDEDIMNDENEWK